MFLEFLEAITGVFVVVYDGQHALKFTLGRAHAVVGPGVHFKWPIVQRFQVRNTKHTTLDLEPQVIQLQDQMVYEVDAKVMYQIVNLRKAIVEIDDLETGLQNRVVMAVQRVLQAQDRKSIQDTDALISGILEELRPVEQQWGVRILQLGFSNISPSPTTLEITQLDLLARERLILFRELLAGGLPEEACVALVTGAVVTTHPAPQPRGRVATARAEERAAESIPQWIEEERKRPSTKSKLEQDDEDEGPSAEDEPR